MLTPIDLKCAGCNAKATRVVILPISGRKVTIPICTSCNVGNSINIESLPSHQPVTLSKAKNSHQKQASGFVPPMEALHLGVLSVRL